MKKNIMVLAFVLSMILCVQTVQADVIWEPQDSFYAQHWEECEQVERTFIANGPDGKVIVYESPVSAKEIATVENGTEMWVTWVYEDEDGVKWGINEEVGTGWMPMDYLTVIYDYISFEEDYGDEIVEEEGQIDSSYAEKKIYFWKYPGSDRGEQLKVVGDYLPEYRQTYVDEEGRKWGHCMYYHGIRNYWICLDNLEADYETLYGKDVPEQKAEVPVYDGEPIVPKTSANLWLVGIAVAGVVVVSAILLVKMKRK